jgi:hypothetical protein
MGGEGRGEGGGVGGEGVGWGALGFGDYLDAGLPVAKSAPNPYTTDLGGQRCKQSTGVGRACCCLFALSFLHHVLEHDTARKCWFKMMRLVFLEARRPLWVVCRGGPALGAWSPESEFVKVPARI